jgi:hypothetical protein
MTESMMTEPMMSDPTIMSPAPAAPETPRKVTRARLARRLSHLRPTLLASAAIAVVAVIVGALTVGSAGAIGALAGVALVAASYTVSSVIIAWVDIIDPKLIMGVGLGTYVVKFTILGFVMYFISRTGWAGVVPMGLAIGVGVLAWTSAQAWWTYHAKILYVDTDPE